MEVYPLHKNKEFTTACADILNQQWPRSMGARLHSLSKSRDSLPVALAFVHDKDVIGFSKLSAVQGKQKSCLLESVVIRESDRGKGLGRTLMELTEKYAKGVGIETIYLNTIDKEGFYAHLGYIICQPVISLGENAHRIPESMLQHFMTDSFSDTNNVQSFTSVTDICDSRNENSSNKCHKLRIPDASAAAPNGLISTDEASTACPSPASHATPTAVTSSSLAPPSPAPPPPPSLPESLTMQPKRSNMAVTRLDPKQVIWMKKDTT